MRRRWKASLVVLTACGAGAAIAGSSLASAGAGPPRAVFAPVPVAKAICARIPVAASDPAAAPTPAMAIPPGGRCEALYQPSGNVRLLLRYPDHRVWAEVFWGPPVVRRAGPRDGVRWFLRDGTTVQAIPSSAG